MRVERVLTAPDPRWKATESLRAKPTVEDATRALTDPENVAGMQRSSAGPLVYMKPHTTLDLLEAMGASKDDARALVAEALAGLGGRLTVERHRGGLGAGRQRVQMVDRIEVPRDAIRWSE